MARSGEYLAAGREFAAAIERQPARLDAYEQLIGILSRNGKDLDKDREKWLDLLPSEARKAIEQDNEWAEKSADYWTDRMVSANPKEPQAYADRSR